jgi:hypothetical protein
MKINNMLLFRGGILDVVIMLDSFSRGVKRLNTNAGNDYHHDAQYKWETKMVLKNYDMMLIYLKHILGGILVIVIL